MSESVIDEGLKIEDIRNQVMSFIKDYLPVYNTWSDSNFEDHISFYMGLGQLLTSQDSEGKINGVLALQFIDEVEERNTLKNDKNSKGVHIQIFVAESQKVREDLVSQAMAISGVKNWISFERCKYNQRVSKLPWRLAERIAFYGRRW